MTTAHGHGPVPETADGWDERYAGADQVWSGLPNGSLVAEVTGLPPGRALDVGSGEGADAVWLARRGWAVTGLDISRVALERAAEHAREAGVEVTWVHSGLLEAGLAAGTFDLVSAHYPVLRSNPGADAERTLLALVAPGGVLLVVHHADMAEHAVELGLDPRDYVAPADVAAALDDGWRIEVDERRPRHVTTGAGARHDADVVLRARRLPTSI